MSDALSQENYLIDNEFNDGVRRFDLVGSLAKCIGKDRRTGSTSLEAITMTLLVWVALKSPSVHCFCSELCQYMKESCGRAQDIIYDFWGREDINWAKWATQLSRRVCSEIDLGSQSKMAFVVDDTLKERRGRKVEGSSKHYDHNSGKTFQGHQVLELGLACENGFIPVDRQIFMGAKNPVEKAPENDFKDKRSAAAQDMKRAREDNKHQMLERMLKNAIRMGHRASCLIGDAWFGTKQNIGLAIKYNLHAIFQMKRGKLQYRVDGKLKSATQIYVDCHRKMTDLGAKSRYKAYRLEAEINLESDKNAEPRWQPIVLILSAQKQDTIKTWVIFLSTDLKSSTEQILSSYALRWSVEVYFKEAKQSFGLLSEQSGKYQVAYASVNLAAVRYLLIFEAMQRSGNLTFGEVRDRQFGKLVILTYAGLLWNLFRAILSGALDQFKKQIGKETIETIMEAIDGAVETFLNEALQLTPPQVSRLQEAEAKGLI